MQYPVYQMPKDIIKKTEGMLEKKMQKKISFHKKFGGIAYNYEEGKKDKMGWMGKDAMPCQWKTWWGTRCRWARLWPPGGTARWKTAWKRQTPLEWALTNNKKIMPEMQQLSPSPLCGRKSTKWEKRGYFTLSVQGGKATKWWTDKPKIQHLCA